MYYFTADTISQANKRIETLDAKMGGLLCVLHCLSDDIEENISYTIDGEKLRKQLSFVFDKEPKDSFESAKPSYIIFAKDWANTFFANCIKNKVDLLSCAVFFLRRYGFEREFTNDEVIDTFLKRFNLTNYKDKWFFDRSNVILSYNQRAVEDNQTDFYFKRQYVSDFKSILFNSVIQKSAADLKAAGQIQTLYSGSGIQKCFLLSDEPLDQYYVMVNSKRNEDQKENPEETQSAENDKDPVGTNVILYGVPGCGKSHKIKTEYCDNEDYMERVVFHPDYTYSDFIGQILPENDNGHISYPFIPGPFTRVLKKAEADPDNNYYLIIEELNRGNAPAIFGEIFQLLDRIDGVSEYGINNSDIALKVYGDATHQVRLPKNLFILATMNTADQNVFTLDTAFKRRWKMRSITNDINGCFFGGRPICNSNVSWKSFLKTINEKIIELGEGSIGSEDKRLGAYFVQPGELSDIDAFAEKVLMYLWNDAFKYEHEKVFKPQYKTLEQLISGFKNTLFDIFNDNLAFSADCIDTVYDPSDDDSTSTGSSTAIWVPCSNFVKSWVENKKRQTNSIISSVLVKRGVTYKRFTTQLFDRLIPVSTSNTSGWNTTNHYFYEIVMKTNKLYVQFVCNVNSDTPQNILDAFENNVFPVTGRKLSEGLQWYCNRICDALPLTPDIEEEKVTEYLEKCYAKVVEFERAFPSSTTVNG